MSQISINLYFEYSKKFLNLKVSFYKVVYFFYLLTSNFVFLVKNCSLKVDVNNLLFLKCFHPVLLLVLDSRFLLNLDLIHKTDNSVGFIRNLWKPLVAFPGLTYHVPGTRLCQICCIFRPAFGCCALQTLVQMMRLCCK